MPGQPVSIGAQVLLTPGAAGIPDSGTIMVVLPPFITANGMPLATTGSMCLMVNSLTGVPYMLPIGQVASSGVTVGGKALVRMGDRIPTPPGIMLILGPPAAPFITDQWPP
jgi:hypothetical protein